MMDAVRKIGVQPWMEEPATRKVMECLNRGHAQPQALFVGGCVRNTVMGIGFEEIDIATCFTPDKITEILKDESITVIPTGIDHGTVTAIIDNRSFEITTLRQDVKTDGRHAQVVFTDDWKGDAQRRDFTMNTLLADTQGNIYDPLGAGLEDIEARRVIFVGDAQERLKEDYLRILRFFRFFAIYGEGEPDRQALDACRAAAPEIKNLSRERITQEFLKILAAVRAPDILSLMFENGVLADLPHKNFKAGVINAVEDVMARLVVLADGEEEHWNALEQYLVLSNKQKSQFLGIIAAINKINQGPKALVYHYGAHIAEQALRIDSAFKGENPDLDPDLDIVHNWQVPDFPVGGDDVMAVGVEKGPEVGRILKAVEQWWIENDFTPDRETCLEKMKQLISAGR